MHFFDNFVPGAFDSISGGMMEYNDKKETVQCLTLLCRDTFTRQYLNKLNKFVFVVSIKCNDYKSASVTPHPLRGCTMVQLLFVSQNAEIPM